MFCMRLISLHYQKNCVWTSLKCHTSPPPNPWRARLSTLRPTRAYDFRLRMDICVHDPGINGGGIQRKHISLL